MEADWETEVGPLAPVIDALWPGFVDLRRSPDAIVEIAEAQWMEALARALLRINGAESLRSESGQEIWTSKCDLWTVEEELDASEMNADQADAVFGLRCYIDLLPRQGLVFADVPEAEGWAKRVIARLRSMPRPNCRVDLVLRRALAGPADGVGITAYLTGCGANKHLAQIALSEALDMFAGLIVFSANR